MDRTFWIYRLRVTTWWIDMKELMLIVQCGLGRESHRRIVGWCMHVNIKYLYEPHTSSADNENHAINEYDENESFKMSSYCLHWANEITDCWMFIHSNASGWSLSFFQVFKTADSPQAWISICLIWPIDDLTGADSCDMIMIESEFQLWFRTMNMYILLNFLQMREKVLDVECEHFLMSYSYWLNINTEFRTNMWNWRQLNRVSWSEPKPTTDYLQDTRISFHEWFEGTIFAKFAQTLSKIRFFGTPRRTGRHRLCSGRIN